MLFLANHRRLLLTLLASIGVLWSLLVLFHSSSSDSTTSLLTSLKEGASSSFDFDWSSTSTTSSSAEDMEEEGEEEMKALVEGEGEMRSPLYREFKGREYVELDQRKPFAEVAILGDQCLELWIGQGLPCPPSVLDASPPNKDLDIVWTWGNGSDPLWKPLYEHFLSLTPTSPEPPGARHYRSAKDELRHSLRSVMANVSPLPRRLHLVLGDWEGPDGSRIGQMPGWLDWSAGVSEDGRVLGLYDEGEEATTELFVHHHSDLFIRGDGVGGAEGQRNHTRDVLPTYNSFAIESNFHSIPNLSSTFAYFNDDFFLLKPHTRSDFASPLYGPVLRLSSPKSYVIPPYQFPAAGCEHEWSSLLRSAWLLSQRYARKNRGYLVHVAKSLSHPLLLETNAIWRDDYDFSSKRRFRETSGGKVGDLNTAWLSSWLLVERARESVLWVWAVARLGGQDGVWGKEERAEVKRLLGWEESEPVVVQAEVASNSTVVVPVAVAEPETRALGPKLVNVKQVERETLEVEKVDAAFQALDEKGPLATKYYWSSRDGPLPGLGGRKKASCSFSVKTCFGTWFENEDETISASDMFKRIAFGGDGVCGDCIFTALISASGSAGLSAVLPSPDEHLVLPQSHIPSSPPTNPNLINLQPHMPLTRTWIDTDFSLPSVLALTNPSDPQSAINLRTFSLQLIARYQWVSASTNALFTMVVDPKGFGELVEKVEKDKNLASVATNDDILEIWEPVLSPLVRAWYGAKWSVKGWWERPGV